MTIVSRIRNTSGITFFGGPVRTSKGRIDPVLFSQFQRERVRRRNRVYNGHRKMEGIKLRNDRSHTDRTSGRVPVRNRHSRGKCTFGWSGLGSGVSGENSPAVGDPVIGDTTSGVPDPSLLIPVGHMRPWVTLISVIGRDSGKWDGVDKERCLWCYF